VTPWTDVGGSTHLSQPPWPISLRAMEPTCGDGTEKSNLKMVSLYYPHAGNGLVCSSLPVPSRTDDTVDRREHAGLLEVSKMIGYRLFPLDEGGRIIAAPHEIECHSDHAAVTMAMELVHKHHAVEVWSGARLVRCVLSAEGDRAA
jgi:hypothetical protein